MSLTLIHTADWQIGRNFGSSGTLDVRKRTLLSEARVTVIDRIAQAATQAGDFGGSRHVLVAGDVFDSPTVPDPLLRQTLARLDAHRAVTWHLLPGNHDPLRAGGIWDRLARIGLPANVVVHACAEPYDLCNGVPGRDGAQTAVLLPAPLTAKASDRDPTAWMQACATPAGQLRIGLAHGSVRGFGSEQAAQQIAPDRAKSAGLVYLALGDWHGSTRIDDRTWYSGTPEPDRFRDNDPGNVLAVHLAGDQAPPRVERIRVAHYTWASRTAVLDTEVDWDAAAAGLVPPGLSRDRLLLKLGLSGTVTLAERLRIEADLARLEPALFHLEADLDGLRDQPDEADLEALGSASLRAVAARLQAYAQVRSDTPEDGQREAARLALRKLIRLEAELAGDGLATGSSGSGHPGPSRHASAPDREEAA